MTPKEKAFDLVVIFTDKHNGVRKELAKKFATICVNQIIIASPHEFWIEVKQEIEKL